MILDKKVNKIETFQAKEILDKNGVCVINNFIDISKIVPFQNEFNTPMRLFNKMTDKEKILLGFKHISPKNEFIRVGSRSKFIEKPFLK